MKILIFVLILLLLPGAPTAAAGAAPPGNEGGAASDVMLENMVFENGNAAYPEVKGDVNGDGKVSSSDCVALSRFCAGMTVPEFFLYQADIDRDGDGDITDLVILLRYLSGYDVSRATEVKTGGSNMDILNTDPREPEEKATERDETLAPEDAGKKYLAAVAAAGKAYDEASETARALFEEAISGQLSQDEYSGALTAYRNAVTNAREVYAAALNEAKTALNSEGRRQP